MAGVPHRPSYGVLYLSAYKICSSIFQVGDFNTRNKCLTAKLLKQGYQYHKLRKAFSKFYGRHNELVSKFNVGLKSLLLHQNFMVTYAVITLRNAVGRWDFCIFIGR